MYSPKFKPWSIAPLIELQPGSPSPWFRSLARVVGGPYLRHALLVDSVSLEGSEHAIALYRKAQEGRGRFMVTFRHPGDDDPQVMFYTLNFLLEPLARKAGLSRKPSAIFLSGAELPLWGGALVAFALKNAGTIPVSHGAMNKGTMDTIMSTIVDSDLPVSLAPEGQVTYYSHVVPQIDLGSAQIALWAQARLKDRAARQGSLALDMELLPVGLVYHFPTTRWKDVERFTSDMETMVGLEGRLPPELAGESMRGGSRRGKSPKEKDLLEHYQERFRRAWERIMDLGEEFYGRTYHYRRPADASSPGERLLALCSYAMDRAEAYLGTGTRGDLRERVMFLRAHSMDLSFQAPERLKKATWLQKRMDERSCSEAYWLHRHQELADLSFYLTDDTVLGFSTFDHLVESAQNLQDLAQRFVGGNFGYRRRFFRKHLVVRFGQPLGLGEAVNMPRREAVGHLTARLHESFVSLLDKRSTP